MSHSLRNAKRIAGVRRSGGDSTGEQRASAVMEDPLSEFSSEEFSAADIEEFREFMASGEDEPQADPLFKERLRRDLWWTMVSRLSHRGKVPDS